MGSKFSSSQWIKWEEEGVEKAPTLNEKEEDYYLE